MQVARHVVVMKFAVYSRVWVSLHLIPKPSTLNEEWEAMAAQMLSLLGSHSYTGGSFARASFARGDGCTRGFGPIGFKASLSPAA